MNFHVKLSTILLFIIFFLINLLRWGTSYVNNSLPRKEKVLSGNALIKIPKIIIQTLKAKTSDEYLKKTYHQFFRKSKASFSIMVPKYEHIVMTDYEQADWVKLFYPLIYPFYVNFTYDIHRSDFVRYLLIYHYGGYYFDSDVVLLQSIEDWYSLDETNGKEINLLFGIEGINHKEALANNYSNTWRPQQVISWTFAATPRHPFFEYLVRLILSKRVARMKNYQSDVAEFASPAVLTDAIASYLLFKRTLLSDLFDKGGNTMVDDMFLAEVNAFSCGTMWSEKAKTCDESDRAMKVRHLYAGSWRDSSDGLRKFN